MLTTNHDIYYLGTGDPESQIAESATQAGSIENALDVIVGSTNTIDAFGIRYYADASARDLALTDPDVGWLTQLLTEAFPRRWNGSAWLPYAAGHPLITPSSVGGSGVTQSGFVVSYSGSSSIIVNGVFNNDFRVYGIQLDLDSNASTTADLIRFKLRASNTTVSTGYYDAYHQVEYAGGATTTSSDSNVTGGIMVGRTEGSSILDGEASGSFFVHNPALSTRTFVQGAVSSTAYAVVGASGFHSGSTPFDGFELVTTLTSINGSLRVFGVS